MTGATLRDDLLHRGAAAESASTFSQILLSSIWISLAIGGEPNRRIGGTPFKLLLGICRRIPPP